MSVHIVHVFECDAPDCDARTRDDHRHQNWHRDRVLPQPSVPDGWTRLGPSHYCPEHEVAVQVDEGDPVEITGRK